MTDVRKVAEKAFAMKMKWPHVPIMCNKRDIDAAFMRVKVHPDMSAILCAEFSAELLGVSDDDTMTVLFLYLTLPFGWRASPAYFSRMGEGLAVAHREFRSHDRNRDGADPFDSQLFVDDAIFIEPEIGLRKEVALSCWEDICRRLLGQTSINDDKVELEGDWDRKHIILGFEINADSLTIRLPKPKCLDAWQFFQDAMLSPGNRIVTVGKVQGLRGLINHWIYACRFWHYMASAVNALMSFGDETNTWIRRSNDHVWIAWWNLIAFVRALGGDGESLDSLFCGKLEQIIPLPKRVGRKQGSGNTVWATGDAVKERIGAINWEKREYIVEDTDQFLPEIAPEYRRVTIGDAEQLAATSIVLAWCAEDHLLLLGTDNRNVLAWTKKGYAKKGAALVLNQETSKWIANRRASVEGVYVRSGHNFSADWLTRATYDQIEKWAAAHGFARVRLKPLWGRMLADYKSLKLKEKTMPDYRLDQKKNREELCVEWNGCGSSFVNAVHGFGFRTQYLQHRHSRMIRQFDQWYGHEPFDEETKIFVLGGAAKTEAEVLQFRQVCRAYIPKYSVLMAPMGVDMSAGEWDLFMTIDSTLFGDLMGSVWQIGMYGISKMSMKENQEYTPFVKTLGGRYAECGLLPAGDDRGIVAHQAIQFSRGLEVFITNEKRQKRLSVNSSIGLLSLQNVRKPETGWPLVISNSGDIREISLAEKCVVLGNKSRWKEVIAEENVTIDTVWRSTPLMVWKEIIGELIDGFQYLPSEPDEEGDIAADVYGFQHYGNDDEGSGAEELEKYWPEAQHRRPTDTGEKGNVKNRT